MSVFKDSPNCLGAKVDRIVLDFECRYCGAAPYARCRTKSGAIDPAYHNLRWLDARDAYDQGYRTPATQDVPGYPPWPKFKKSKRRHRPKAGVLTEPPPMQRRMTIS